MNDFLPKICFDNHQDCLKADWVAWLAVVATIVGVTFSLAITRITDLVGNRIKLILIVINSLCVFLLSALSLVTLQVVTFPKMVWVKVVIYIILLSSFTLGMATIPLSAELAVEICYPAAEVVVTGWLTIWYVTTSNVYIWRGTFLLRTRFCFRVNLISMLFFGIFEIPNIGSDWLNYVSPVSFLVAVPMLLAVRESYNRTGVDEMRQQNSSSSVA